MSNIADICLILEGTYPYVAGGVSSWANNLISSHKDLTFHILCINPDKNPPESKYDIPKNVIGKTDIHIHSMPKGSKWCGCTNGLIKELQPAITMMQTGGGEEAVYKILKAIQPYKNKLGSRHLLESVDIWQALVHTYETIAPETSFINYYWSWRGLLNSFFAIALADIPPAKVYHSLSTGYAGLMAYNAKLHTGRPVILTEHGIYTNERRIEISLADWLADGAIEEGFSVDNRLYNVKDLWVNTFLSYSKACYSACEEILTLYSGNQLLEKNDGADESKMKIIPNGIDCKKFGKITKDNSQRPLNIALIGRVVPIKDVKTFIRACSIVHGARPDVNFMVIGSTDEDEDYFKECELLTAHMGLQNVLTFTGRKKVEEIFPQVDVAVLTSINEAQPLILLEAGAAGIACVATDIGSCREILLGTAEKEDHFGDGGIITPLASPRDTGHAILELISDKEKRILYGENLKNRINKYYNKVDVDKKYGDIYKKYINHEGQNVTDFIKDGEKRWQE